MSRPEPSCVVVLTIPDELFVWNEQEHEWIEVPLGHSVVKGALGEFYPISPAAIAATYEPAEGATP